jgi:micrococcal nuclease
MDQRRSALKFYSHPLFWVGSSLIGMVIGTVISAYIFFSLDISHRATEPAQAIIEPSVDVEVNPVESEEQKEVVEPKQAAKTPETEQERLFEKAEVIAVVDGDTIDVLIDGVQHRVHYILIDIPENEPALHRLTTAAKEFNQYMVEGKTVLMHGDVYDTDENGDLLRYVYVGENMVLVNMLLIDHGFARIDENSINTGFRAQLQAVQEEAQKAKRGIWYNYTKPSSKTLPKDGSTI